MEAVRPQFIVDALVSIGVPLEEARNTKMRDAVALMHAANELRDTFRDFDGEA